MSAADLLVSLSLNEERYLALLEKLIGEAEFVQNNPPSLVPQEDRICNHVLELLRPFSTEHGGPLVIEHVSFVEGRGNLIITYPGTGDKVISFVGSHMDVVPANPETWERNPFQLVREGDRLYGRGTTDCLGHVALVSTLLSQLAEAKLQIATTIHAVFIASEEADGPGVGIDGLMTAGKLDVLKRGPVLWIDCADSQPCIGTAGSITWHLHASGKLFHSGLPHKAINAIELASEAVKYIQDEFYKEFPAHPNEEKWKFITPSTLKPTQISCAKGGINQIPGSCTISGDIRVTPFYKIDDIKAAVERYVAHLNDNLHVLPTRGPVSKFSLPTEGLNGKLELTWGGHDMTGIACSLDSPGFHHLCSALLAVKGDAKPYAICGSLPLVDQMQAAGFDIQLVGFGLSATYHADNEYSLLSDMKAGIQVLARLIHGIDQS